MPVIRSMVACRLWTIFSWHWVWTRLRLLVPEELAVEVSGMCRFKDLALPTMNRFFFFHAQRKKVPNLERWSLLRKHTFRFSVLLLEGSSNKNLMIQNTLLVSEEEIISIFHTQQEVCYTISFTLITGIKVAKLSIFMLCIENYLEYRRQVECGKYSLLLLIAIASANLFWSIV